MAPSMLRFLALTLLLVAVAAEDYHAGTCKGSLLSEQAASNATKPDEHYLVAFSGNPGDRISCVVVEDLSLSKMAQTSLLRGGPGQRYAVISVKTSHREDANFVVRIYGTRLHPIFRRKRAARSVDSVITGTMQLLTLVGRTVDTLLVIMKVLAVLIPDIQDVTSGGHGGSGNTTQPPVEHAIDPAFTVL